MTGFDSNQIENQIKLQHAGVYLCISVFMHRSRICQKIYFCVASPVPLASSQVCVNKISDKCLQGIWHKCPTGLNHELIRIWWSEVSVISPNMFLASSPNMTVAVMIVAYFSVIIQQHSSEAEKYMNNCSKFVSMYLLYHIDLSIILYIIYVLTDEFDRFFDFCQWTQTLQSTIVLTLPLDQQMKLSLGPLYSSWWKSFIETTQITNLINLIDLH